MLHVLSSYGWGNVSAWALLVAFVATCVSSYFNNGLNKYPAPSFAAFTNFWRFLVVARRQAHFEYLKLHQQLGDVVRLGPNALSFADPKAVKDIYGLSKKLPKVSQHFIHANRSNGSS